MASAARHQGRGAFASTLVLLAFLLAALAPSGAEAAPPLLREFCPTGSSAGECSVPRGISVDASSGDVYVVDQNNARIQKFSAWGEVLRVWGWDVVASGPGDSAPLNQFEVCVPAEGDVCKAGLEGTGEGQFNTAQGVAVDSAGGVFVVDWLNRRVQKFSPEGEFLLMFGGEVNKTKVEEVGSTEAQRNLCPVDPGDVCGAGIGGNGNGQFGAWEEGSYIATVPGSPETVSVGDQGRVQRFDTAGNWLGDLPDPGEVLKEETVNSLAADPVSGALYVALFQQKGSEEAKPDVRKLSSAGNLLCTIKAHYPRALAVGPVGEVYVVKGKIEITDGAPREVARFESNCGGEVTLLDKVASDAFTTNPTAIAASAACGIEGVDLFISNPDQEDSYIRAYGPPPQDLEDPCRPPPALPPTIVEQYAASVGIDGATVRARINPHFWNDTTYRVQYGTAACVEGGWEAACVKEQPISPGALLSKEVIDAELLSKGIFLGAAEPLLPDTAYRYRFIAQSSGGGPVFGEEKGFRTFPPPPSAKACPNQAFRGGASARLPDCRAYEMVSPVDKNGGEVASPSEVLDQATVDGDALTYASGAVFGDPEGAPPVNQYVAERDPEAGWITESINAPRSSVSLLLRGFLESPYKLFSEDLCSGWLLQDTDVPLVGGEVPRGVANLYRRPGLREGCGGAGGYELLSTVFPPGFEPEVEKTTSRYYPMIQGFSADGETSVYRAAGALTSDACATPAEGKGIFQVYLSRNGSPGVAPRLVSVLPGGEAACTHSSVGTAQFISDDSIQRAVSDDGSRVFWTATDDATVPTPPNFQAGNEPGKIFLRLNPAEPQSAFEQATGTGNLKKDSNQVNAVIATSGQFEVGQAISADGIPAGTTIVAIEAGKLTLSAPATKLKTAAALSAKGCSEPGKACTLPVSAGAEVASGSAASRYLGAAEDGSVAIFQTGEDLYEFDTAKALAGEAPTTLIAPEVLGLMGTSADASRVYLVSEADLDEGASGGEANLYLYRRGVGFSFIATLSGEDLRTSSPPSPIALFPSLRTSRVSPDGLHLAFSSSDAALAEATAGYDNTEVSSGEPASELYLYAADSGDLVCASCNPSGARPSGQQVWSGDNGAAELWAAARIPGWSSALHPSRALSDDGSRLFFESFEALVPRDTNGKQDVYEWERVESKAECLVDVGGELFVAESGGCLSLISSGQSKSESEFVDASADGRDVFFLTGSSLLPHDEGFKDIYDARGGGGFPPPPPREPECEGDACRSPAPAPEDPTPASSAPRGFSGNLPPPSKVRCGKDKRRVARKDKVRCVPKAKHRKHQAKHRKHKQATGRFPR